jgi:hypothetical protein
MQLAEAAERTHRNFPFFTATASSSSGVDSVELNFGLTQYRNRWTGPTGGPWTVDVSPTSFRWTDTVLVNDQLVLETFFNSSY